MGRYHWNYGTRFTELDSTIGLQGAAIEQPVSRGADRREQPLAVIPGGPVPRRIRAVNTEGSPACVFMVDLEIFTYYNNRKSLTLAPRVQAQLIHKYL